MNDIFHFVERPYNLGGDYALKRKRDHTVYHGSGSLSSLAPKLWDRIPNSIKNLLLSSNSKQKVFLRHLTAVYARNMLGE